MDDKSLEITMDSESSEDLKSDPFLQREIGGLPGT